tara:strand:- start:383 stop:1453 length:1071 start_codon:yes stop_codon:yes gene_type:complete
MQQWILSQWTNLVKQMPILGNKYIVSLVIVILAVIGAKLLLLIFEKFLQKFAAKTKTELDDLIFAKTKKPFFYLILTYGFKLALLNIGAGVWISQLMNSLMAIVFLIIIGAAIDVVIEGWSKTMAHRTQSKIDDVLLPLFHKIVKVIMTIIGVLWVMKIWGLSITPYLAGAGVGGIVIGFALQDSLKNIFGGITLLLDKNFEVGDKIKIESGELGEIKDISLRSTKIRTYDNEIIHVPNGYLANSRILNYTHPNSTIRVKVDFGVEYGSDIEKVKKLVLETVRDLKDIILADKEPQVQFLEMGDSALNFRALFWIDNWRKSHAKKLEATQAIYDALNKEGIGIPFPTRTIYMKKEE